MRSLKVPVAATQANVGKPDILVCNAAGKATIGPLEKVEATVFDEAMISNARNNLLLANLRSFVSLTRRVLHQRQGIGVDGGASAW
jgi:NAD(P)-dependent dehydrogenase (short-subunit alcohol dehydrogenase family)